MVNEQMRRRVFPRHALLPANAIRHALAAIITRRVYYIIWHYRNSTTFTLNIELNA